MLPPPLAFGRTWVWLDDIPWELQSWQFELSSLLPPSLLFPSLLSLPPSLPLTVHPQLQQAGSVEPTVPLSAQSREAQSFPQPDTHHTGQQEGEIS